MNDKQHITVQLDAHTISLNVERDKEPIYRKAADMLNRLYHKYSTSVLPKASAEQLWVNVALLVAVNLQNDANKQNLEAFEKSLRDMSQHIQDVLAADPTLKKENL